MPRVLIIEDDEALKKQIGMILIDNGFEVLSVDYSNIIDYVKRETLDLIILDINLPYLDGNYYCRMIRRNSNVPIIVTSARNSDADQILSMELGSDDYLVKPFNINILLSKVNAILRRTKTAITKYKGLNLDEAGLKLTYKDKVVELSKNEYRLLHIFLTKPKQIITREELLEEIWDDKMFVDDNTLTVNVTRIKNRLEEIGITDAIKTKRGMGYIFEVEE